MLITAQSSLLSTKEVYNIFNNNYKKFKEQGFLDCSKYLVTRYIFWHSECQIPSKQRSTIWLEEFNKLRNEGKMQGRAYGDAVINDAIEVFQDGKAITRPLIMRYTGLSFDQERYLKPFKSLVDDYNENLKANKLEGATATN